MSTITTAVYWSTFVHSALHERPLHVAATERGLCCISLPEDTHLNLQPWVDRKFRNAILVEDREKLKPYLEQLQAYCERNLTSFELPLDLQGTSFQVSVWRALMTIPYGHSCSYADIAAIIDRPQAIRAVGTANGANPIPIIIPCHRVIGKNGSLTGYSGGLKMKETLLQLEGYIDYSAKGHVRFNF
ncbi:methylated-DNA--[protein]-cysteine S-methyltransferase [Paenibacillus tyrfis]|uniref:methylated-DNA--[protein]-cysteine S-methyltransferase n=1 Tax=Paenibacillus tyrfis TaxID=1501230 RepID=UPI000B592B3D|nr:methylated-DNA--[protein]-cysteine S-methyltransferase [Paenibacillus tyrfis]